MSSFTVPETPVRTILAPLIVMASLALLTVSIAGGFSTRAAAGAVIAIKGDRKSVV